jgi:hypothetical protein
MSRLQVAVYSSSLGAFKGTASAQTLWARDETWLEDL